MFIEFLDRNLFGPGHQAAQLPVMIGTVGQDEELMPGMEGHQVAEIWFGRQEFPPALQHEDALDKVFPEDGIMEPPLLFHRQEGEVLHKDAGEHPHPPGHRRPLGGFVVDPDPLHAAAGGFALENKTAQVLLLQFLHPFPGPGDQAVREIDLGADGHQAGGFRVAHQTHGFPGHPQAAFHFGTDGHEFHILPQGVGDKPIPLVAAVKPDWLTQQAGADSQPNFLHKFHFF